MGRMPNGGAGRNTPRPKELVTTACERCGGSIGFFTSMRPPDGVTPQTFNRRCRSGAVEARKNGRVWWATTHAWFMSGIAPCRGAAVASGDASEEFDPVLALERAGVRLTRGGDR